MPLVIIHRTLLVAMLAVLAVVPATLRAEEPVCDASESRVITAPDGNWKASVQEEVCSAGTGAAAGITVVLASTRDPALKKRVLNMPVPRSREDWPRVRWLAADAVELRVANLSETPAPEPQFAGIRITLDYCDDNPGDRARLTAYKAAVLQWQKDVSAWAQKRKANPDTAGPRPDRPEEPKLPFGHCKE